MARGGDEGLRPFCVWWAERWTPDRDTPLVLRDELTWHPPGAAHALTIQLPAFFDRVSAKLRLIGQAR